MKGEFLSHSASETEALGAELAKTLPKGAVVSLNGDLGAGKTAFVRGMAAALGYEGRVTSPTFTIVNEYRKGRDTVLLHFDMYRLSSEEDLYGIGWYDYLDVGAVCAVEWAERVEGALPSDAISVTIEGSGEAVRRITIE
ncbi:MAG: tRNA (adenosine(37)-N6)-threonylcarbamoyltransferase complex ATPase subunit type 1 TsaE [Clostridia bacterium]|nr:tRNA (adenosine(37)-N6)-threonylcarbamoyltransferase complex ATPase subunit type 1 TsaE [Clostridia bacterium]